MFHALDSEVFEKCACFRDLLVFPKTIDKTQWLGPLIVISIISFDVHVQFFGDNSNLDEE